VTRLWHDLGRAYSHRIVDTGREGEFLVLVAFLVTFVIVRTVTHGIRDGRGPLRNVQIRGWHMHHLVPGIVLLLVTGYLAVAVDSQIGRRTVSIFFGIGAALTLDEFALWIHLKDVYWEREGRASFEAMALFGGMLCMGIFGSSFFRGIGKELFRRRV